jgi:DNA-binding winged helix-turn-helix (wHTH) protein
MIKISFGPFTLDDEQHQVSRGGEPLHLSLKAYELLKLLLVERPRAIPKNELHDRLWPDTFVSDASLATLVAELRTALGETGRRAGLLRTVHGFGYAFVGEAVEEARTPAKRTAPGPRAQGCVLILGDREFELREGESVIGRDEDVQVSVRSLSVSRRHARIVASGSTASIEDMGSKNGTIVRGTRITERTPLHDGDRIQVGTFTFTFRAVMAGGSTATIT